MKQYIIATLILLTALTCSAGIASATDRHVYPGGSIQAAINCASAGDTIYVHAGTYTENVDVDKQLTIRSMSEDPADTIVHAVDSDDYVFHVTVDYVNISGFSVIGATNREYAGIYLYDVDNCNISNNIATNNTDGIHLNNSSCNTLQNNTCSGNSGCGIILGGSSNNNLQDNTADSNSGRIDDDGYGYGIYLQDSSCNILMNNTANSNSGSGRRGSYSGDGYCYGIYLYYSSDNILTNNTADSNSARGG